MLPQFVFDEYPVFVEFTETFLDFVEKKYSPDKTPNPGPYHILKNLLETSDIDETALEFVQTLKIKLGRDLPASTAYDLRTFLKHIKNFYLSKGTENSIQFFFRSVFNTYSRIYLPKVDLVRASYSTWYVPYVTQFKPLSGNPSDPPYTSSQLLEFFDASLYGQTSKQTAWLGGVKAGDYIEILAHSGEFTPGETVTITKTDGTSVDLWIPIGGIEFLEGTFLTDDGMPSSTKRLQDSYYWQDFSYDVISPNEIADIVNPLVMNVHPAGLKIFARVTEENPVIVDPDGIVGDDSEILLIRELTIHVENLMEDDAEDPIELIQFPLNFGFTSYVQSYVDVGEFFQEEDTLAFSLVYPNNFAFDGQTLTALEKDEPQFNLFVSFGGYKLPAGNETVPGYVDDGARVFSYADQSASIGFGGFSIETFENLTIEESGLSYSRNLARRHARSEVLSVDYDFETDLYGSATVYGRATVYGGTPIDDGWSNSGTTGKVALVFHDGKFIKPPLAELSTEIVEGVRVAKLEYDSLGIFPRPWLTSKPLFEILYLSEIDMGGNHGADNRASFTLTAGQTIVNWSELPEDSTALLVFKNGWNLVPFRDFIISNGKLILSNSSSANDSLDVFILQTRESAGVSLVPLVGPDETYKLLRPVDAPLEVIPTKLSTVLPECVLWCSFEEQDYSYDAQMYAPSWGTGDMEAYYYPGQFVDVGPFDSTLVGFCNDTSGRIGATGAWDVSNFITTADDPFSVNIWVKFSDIAHEQTICVFGRGSTLDPSLLTCSLKLSIVKSTGEFKLVGNSGDGTTLTTLESALGDVVPDTWYMVNARFDEANFKIRIYSAGQITSLSTPMTGVVRPIHLGTPYASIGFDNSAATTGLVGAVAHMGLWNVALRDHEVDALYNNGNGLDKPVYYI